jgi:predicted transcriptional regulator
MDEDRIVLDRKSFEALAVDSRVKILKSLKERRKTLSELAKEQNMSVSGVKEHLETLEKVGLIEKIDDGHKWKYYELTKKGRDIVAPKELRVWILLSISTLALVASMFALLSAPGLIGQTEAGGMENAAPPQAPTMAVENESAFAVTADEPVENADARAMAAAIPEAEPVPKGPPAPDLAIPTAVAIISGLTLVACLGILARNRMRTTSL